MVRELLIAYTGSAISILSHDESLSSSSMVFQDTKTPRLHTISIRLSLYICMVQVFLIPTLLGLFNHACACSSSLLLSS